MPDTITNKVADSGLITIDPADFYVSGERTLFDLKPLLVEEVLLREKDFREFVSTHNWSQYREKYVAITCTSDAIIPVWAYMLLASALQPFAKKVVFGTMDQLESALYREALSKLDVTGYTDRRVVIKGCGDLPVPVEAYMEITARLRPVAKSIMYGEPCSTVPVFKRK